MNVLSHSVGSARDAVLFNRSDVWVGTQHVQVIGGELSCITIDDAVFVGYPACDGIDQALNRANVGRTGDTLLEGDNVSAGDSTGNLRNSDERGGRSKDREKESGESEELLGEHAEGS